MLPLLWNSFQHPKILMEGNGGQLSLVLSCCLSRTHTECTLPYYARGGQCTFQTWTVSAHWRFSTILFWKRCLLRETEIGCSRPLMCSRLPDAHQKVSSDWFGVALRRRRCPPSDAFPRVAEPFDLILAWGPRPSHKHSFSTQLERRPVLPIGCAIKFRSRR